MVPFEELPAVKAWRQRQAEAHSPPSCDRCGEDDISPNVEAFDLSGETVCDDCAEQIFEDNSQFGVGA